ncbi:MAG TPA: glycosyltransferase family 39 protein [Bryobacteraceae bacterium]|nr:glycosyltransferase family 39 protein [Bryobacteraceae bacterium]
MATLTTTASGAGSAERTETWFRRILIVFAVAAALGILGHLALVFWAQNAFTGGESVVGAHTSMLVHDGTLYYDFHHYPYTVAPYTPLFYLLDAGLQKLGLPVYTAGRLISFAASLGIIVLSWYLTLLYTRDRYSAAMSVLLFGTSSLLFIWGTVGQVDVLGLFWALAAFYLYSRYTRLGERTLVWAGVCVFLSFFTKQTFLACPAAICLHLFFTRRKAVALRFGLLLTAAVAIVCLSIDAALGGRFLADTVKANLNPYSVHKLLLHLRFALFVAGPLVIVAALGARQAIRKCGAAPFAYLGMAALVFLGSAPKAGSDLNYQLEFTMLLMLCASLSLHALDFFRLSIFRSRTWITLLQLPLGVFLVVNLRTTANVLLLRYVTEQQSRVELTALAPYLADGGRVLSADYNALVRLRGRLDMEMAFYNLLVSSGVVDPEPVRRDLAASAFSTIVLVEDVFHEAGPLDVEISTLPAAQLDEIRKHYRLVKQIPGPALDGVYVYKPRSSP